MMDASKEILGSDRLNDADFTQYVSAFMEITTKKFRPQDIIDVLSALRKSAFIRMIMEDPKDESAASCIRSIIKGNVLIHDNFLTQLIKVCSSTIHFHNSFGSALSNTVKINVNNINPPTGDLSRMTARAKKEILQENIKQFTLYPITQNYHSIVPSVTRIKMDRELLDNAINGITQLNKVIIEGNRQNGKTIDSFITQKMVEI